MKTSWKNGLPYGWWRTDRFKDFVWSLVFALVFGALGGLIVTAWFFDLKPWW